MLAMVTFFRRRLQLLYFILSAYGLTQILVYSTIFAPITDLNIIFFTVQCVLAFGSGCSWLVLNGFTELFTFDVSVINAFLNGLLYLLEHLMRYVC